MEFGIMTGVFNVPLKAGGSGFNKIKAIFAHTGVPRPTLDKHNISRPEPRPNASTGDNPFDEAFNLIVADIRGLVNAHIDRYTQNTLSEVPSAKLAELKRAMMAHCIQSYDGYSYGDRPA
ncbi:hypothetical protein GGH93_004236, partial [Coemansia aciculifera]